MAFEHYIRSGNKLLRCGFTTGSCAALAAAGAVRLLLGGQIPKTVSLMTPKGLLVEVTPKNCSIEQGEAVCAVRKDAGEDSDVTADALIFAKAIKSDAGGIFIDGGEGVGRVTKSGLDQPIGAAAINHVPRQMIENEVMAVCDELCYDGGIKVTISVPNGKELAEKTFNPKLGIEGGISILGTSGIVEPMSMQALIDTIAVELRQAASEGVKQIIITPGNYGLDFLQKCGVASLGIPIVKCSNFIGEALDEAALQGFETVLLVGHIGKLIKLAGGIMNTHSRYADCRTELFCAHGAICGADREVCQALMNAATTDACIDILDKAELRGAVMESLINAIERQLEHRAAGAYRIGAVIFSNEYGILGKTK
ncbi:MAG: cobalt-precorrin-5B (C(1))-methyltransferase CbiD, partial [Angelakisella sp.]